ncbi:PhnD/SsuA/transferrin family substrate-binding protein [Archangium primigenium]|uniref:PhnD/SsuA/transferrin family substrate-binding protein n=1 Tax=[Archangium] primigenium TaxID=2792470 RepID=UPI00195D74D0|nr:PhnD/SsuA/transferrin family substrate-binding protein [Archangium primigenium]
MTPSLRPIRFLLYPSLGEVREHVRVELFCRVLSERLGRPVVAEFSPTYEAVDAALQGGQVDMVWGTAEQCDAFAPRARAVLRAVRAGSCRYQAALVCRADAPLTLETLRGQRAAWVAPRSTGGYLMPVRFLEEQGLSPDSYLGEQRFLGTYRRALHAVLSGEADFTSVYASQPHAHAIRTVIAYHMGKDSARFEPFLFTPPALADGIVLTRHLSEVDAARIQLLLTRLNTDGAGLEMLMGPFSVEGFDGSADTRYSPPVARSTQCTEYVVAELDADDHCHRLWSPSGRAFGRPLEDVPGQPLTEALGAEAGEPLLSLARTVRQGGVGGRLEYTLRVEGEARSYVAEISPGPADAAAGGRLGLLVRDVSGMRSLEEPMYRLASFPLLHPEPLLELSPEGALRYANAASHKAFPELMDEGSRHALVQAAMQWAWRGSSSGEPSPTVFLEGHYWELTVDQLRDPPGLRVFARDVTLRKQMEARLIQADRMSALGSLAAAVGHEMNNPLAFMLANLSFAREELERLTQSPRLRAEAGPELGDVLEALAETAQGALRMKHIVQDLRTLSRKPPEHRARVEIRPVLDNALKLVRGELHHRARLERDFHEVPPVDADEARLGQLFLNVLLNAVQSMDAAHIARNVLRVAVYTGEEGNVVVEVQDTGRGLPPEALARLFEPFVTTHPEGSGLGLSVSHAIVTSLGGTLRAESHEGRGTLLTLSLPEAGDVEVSARRAG